MPAPQPDIENELLPRLWAEHGLGRIHTVERPARGSVNHALIVNQQYVARFDLRARFPRRFHGEALAYQQLGGSGLPLPEPVALGDAGGLCPYSYLITTLLPGVPAVDAWPGLGAPQQRTLATEAGRCLARLHCQPCARFGNLRDLPDGGFGRWFDFVWDYFERYARQAQDLKLLDPALLRRARAALAANETLLDDIDRGMLVHSDYHFENILQLDGQVSGLIDFEWALSGDPLWDFIVDDLWEEMCPGSRDWVYQGYGELGALVERQARRLALYKLLMHLDHMVDFALLAQPERLRAAGHKFERVLAALEGRP